MSPRKRPNALRPNTAAARFTRKGMGGDRAPHPPEYNLIQRPDLMRDIAQFLGLRQMHITPALAEGVQAVLVVDDLGRRRVPSRKRYGFGRANGSIGGDGATLSACFGIANPLGATARVHLVRAYFSVKSIGGANAYHLAPVTFPSAGLTAQPASEVFDLNTGIATGGVFAGAPTAGQPFRGQYGNPGVVTYGYVWRTAVGNADSTLFELDLWLNPGQAAAVIGTNPAVAEGFLDWGLLWEEEEIVA